MNFMQQQQIAQAQAMQQQHMAAMQNSGGNPYMMGQNPYMAQQGYAGGAPQYAPPVPGGAPMGMAPAAGGDSTVISVAFPDGCLLGFDRLRNELILNGKQSNTRMPHRNMPARPTKASLSAVVAEDNTPAVPMEKSGVMTKLGWKKTMLGSDSWQPRHFRLGATTLSYHKDGSSPAINTIPLNNGVTVNVVHANSPARKNRYEDMANPGVGGLMTMQVSQIVAQTSGVVGMDNCVEVICAPQVGSMIDGVMANNAIGLAFGGGMKEMKKQGQGRTYYLSCGSLAEAEEWAAAIKNNIRAIPQTGGITGGGPIGGAGGYSGLNNVMNNATQIQRDMADSRDPSKSLGWYKNALGTQLPADQLFACLDRFYNELDRNNVPHP